MVISKGQRKALVWSNYSVLSVFVFIIFAAFSLGSQAVTFKVSPDRDEVDLNDSFTISFRAVGSIDDEPDFSPIEKDFSIVSKQRRRNISINNGSKISTQEWIVEVMARRDGVLIIPAINFGKDKSPETKVLVRNIPASSGQAGPNENIFIEIETLPEQSWVQAQIIYTVRLFRAVNTYNSSLSEPEMTGGQMISEKLEDKQYETTRNNRRYIVLERRYALFPQASGEFTIEPIIFSGQVNQQSRNSFDPFGRNSRTVQRVSRPINLTIKPIPNEYSGMTWLPAKKIEISEKWMKNVLKLEAGEPVTRTIVIKAEGLSSEQLPEIVMQEMSDFKTYPDQPELHNQSSDEGVLGIRQEKSAIIPNKAGEFVLPAVEMTWWNTQTGKMETAQLPERVINVLPSSSSVEEPADVVVDTQPQESTELSPLESSTDSHIQSAGYWPWIALILAMAWLLTLWAWWNAKRIKTILVEQPIVKANLSERQNLRTLREKIKLNDATQVKESLLIWGRSVWPENSPTSLNELGERCGADIHVEVSKLNQSLYGSSAEEWDGERLLQAIDNFDGVSHNDERIANETRLKPLNNI